MGIHDSCSNNIGVEPNMSRLRIVYTTRAFEQGQCLRKEIVLFCRVRLRCCLRQTTLDYLRCGSDPTAPISIPQKSPGCNNAETGTLVHFVGRNACGAERGNRYVDLESIDIVFGLSIPTEAASRLFASLHDFPLRHSIKRG